MKPYRALKSITTKSSHFLKPQFRNAVDKKLLASRLFFVFKLFFPNSENNSVVSSSTNPITDQYLSNMEFAKGDI